MRYSNAPAGAAEISIPVEPLKVRGRFLTAVVLPVTGAPNDGYFASLDALLQQSPGFFSDAPVILDIAQAERLDSKDDFEALLGHLRLRGLTPIGMQNPAEGQKEAASRAGIATLESGRDTPLMKRSRQVAPSHPPAEPPPAAVLVTEPVRSGQRLVAEGGDLIVVAPVSSGAELIAHGNIHVYGSLRGRALAGVHGDRGARIFCQSLEAELVAIAGLYKTSEALGAAVARKRVQVFLDDDTLRVESLK